jgi:hypothetical protein
MKMTLNNILHFGLLILLVTLLSSERCTRNPADAKLIEELAKATMEVRVDTVRTQVYVPVRTQVTIFDTVHIVEHDTSVLLLFTDKEQETQHSGTKGSKNCNFKYTASVRNDSLLWLDIASECTAQIDTFIKIDEKVELLMLRDTIRQRSAPWMVGTKAIYQVGQMLPNAYGVHALYRNRVYASTNYYNLNRKIGAELGILIPIQRK